MAALAMASNLVFGLHAVAAIVSRHPEKVLNLWVQSRRQDRRIQQILDHAVSQGIGVVFKDKRELDEITEGNHQGVLVFAETAKLETEKELFSLIDGLGGPPFLLVLDGVTDPHNLGACLRSANAAGVHAVITPKDNSAGLTDVVRKVACGAAETTPLIAVTNLARTLKKLQDLGVWIVGTSGDAQVRIFDTPLTGALALVMGSEGAGMRRLTREHCDYLAYIPMVGDVSSLNVSVAAGICLFEAVRQRQVTEQ